MPRNVLIPAAFLPGSGLEPSRADITIQLVGRTGSPVPASSLLNAHLFVCEKRLTVTDEAVTLPLATQAEINGETYYQVTVRQCGDTWVKRVAVPAADGSDLTWAEFVGLTAPVSPASGRLLPDPALLPNGKWVTTVDHEWVATDVPPGSGIPDAPLTGGPFGRQGGEWVEAVGPAGPTGPQGPAGPAGADGAQGPQGIQGPAGPAGADGADGAQGPQGIQGPAGPAGADGAQGPQGIQGPAGPAGADGADGAQGPQGIQGPAGPAGADGAQGPQGIQGPAGPAGADGADGAQGPQGIQGPAGPTEVSADVGNLAVLGTDGKLLVDAAHVTPSAIGAEPALGNPGTTGYVLSSTDAGVRSWVAQSGGGGGVDTANSPNANEFARFTDADTIEGRTTAETRADLDLEPGVDFLALRTSYIDGAILSVTADDAISVSRGMAGIESGGVLAWDAAITATGLSLSASTWYYVYVYSSGGTPTLEVSTTAPATPYQGTARSKTGASGYRLLGAVLTNSSSDLIRQTMTPAYVLYSASSEASPFRVLSNGSQTSATAVSMASAIPSFALTVLTMCQSTNATYAMYLLSPSNTEVTYRYVLKASLAAPELLLNASQEVHYKMGGTGGGGYIDVIGYSYSR